MSTPTPTTPIGEETKEEILERNRRRGQGGYVLDAMEEYAAQEKRKEAIAFLEWKDERYIYSGLIPSGKYIQRSGLLKHISECRVFTTAELYDIYFEQSKTKTDEE
jgi:hypothetical protein